MKDGETIDGPEGFRWTVLQAALEPGERGALEALIGRWPELPGRDGAEVFKENYLRSVFAVDKRALSAEGGASRPGNGAAGRWVMKKYRHDGFYDRCRYLVISSRAEREFRALRTLAGWGFPVPRPLAFGLRRERGSPVEGGLVMAEIPGTVPLSDFLAGAYRDAGREAERDGAGGTAAPPREARRLLVEAGRLARRLHDRGVFHPDIHSANFLVDPDRGLHIIDLHSCLFPGIMPGWLRTRALSKIAHSLVDVIPDAELRWFLAGYLGREGDAAGAAAPADGAIRRLESRVRRGLDRLERRRLRSRTRRCIRRSTVFAVRREKGRRIYQRRSFPLAALDALLVPPPGEEGIVPACWMAPGPEGCGELLVRHERYRLGRRLGALLASHPLRRAWIAAHGLEVRGIAAPAALALVEERRLGLVSRAWLIREPPLKGAPLDSWLASNPGGSAAGARRRLAAAIGRLLRRAHDRGVRVRQISPDSVRVLSAGADDDPAPALDAIGAVTFGDRLGRRRRMIDLERLGGLCGARASTAERLRALRAYDDGAGGYYERESIRRLRRGALRALFADIVRITREEFAHEALRRKAVARSDAFERKEKPR